PCRWLAEYVDIEITEEGIKRLAERLTLAGLEVEEIICVPSVTGAFVGRVLSSAPHPNSDHLSLCHLDIGSDEIDVICGANNVVEGRLVPVITVGGELPGGFKISERKLRGVTSHGMICSKAELGLEAKSEGIWNFDDSLDLPLGTDINELLEFDDYVLQIKVTSNRPDCMGIYGIAREVAAITGNKLRPLNLSIHESGPSIDEEGFSIVVEDNKDTPRYTGRLMSGIHVAASPLRVQHRLLKAGMRPLANVIDITNYVMLELGQPLHPFDADRIGKTITVRRAHSGDKFRTLDDVERDLTKDVLMITDENGGLAVAGVMGGERSEIRADTTRVLLESASFEASTIRRSSRVLGLRSEASQRFERRVDPQGVIDAADRTAHLLQDLFGCRVHTGVIDSAPGRLPDTALRLRTERVRSLLGIDVDRDEIARLLGRLKIATEADNEELIATIPSFRSDLDREVDLIEEVGRLYGYDRFPSIPPRGLLKLGKKDTVELYKDRVRNILTGLGMNEVITDGFDKITWRETLGLAGDDMVSVRNPMIASQKSLRASLLPGLLSVVEANLNQRIDGGMIFEVGRVFSAAYGESESLAGVLFGRANLPLHGKEEVDLLAAKGIITNLLSTLDVPMTIDPAKIPFLHPGRAGEIDAGKERIGLFGELAPQIADSLPGQPRAILFEINLDKTRQFAQENETFTPLPRFPMSKRDLSLLAPNDLPEKTIRDTIRSEKIVEQILLYDLYQGEQVGSGKRSLTYEISLRASDRTLTDEQVTKAIARVEKKLAKISVTLRS
ncbi:MAG: phenylalanine--tRNA ligase subunit beta, partial [Candidatus Bipolaricaulota bacterium]|nr:phenylalanine--tRNA ligase subunit beta [Candidatus Bipolaricaulota bacterium]